MLNVMKRLPLSQLPNFPKAEYWALIFELGDSIEKLEATIAERDVQLERALAEVSRLTTESERPAKDSQNASIPPSQDITRQPSKSTQKPTCAKRSRKGHQRQLPTVDTHWECEPAPCACCGKSLVDSPRRLVGCQRVVEIPEIRGQVVEIQRYERECKCGHRQQDDYPAGYQDVHQHFGPRLQALVSYFNGTHHVAHDRLQQMLHEVFGVEMSAGAIVNSLQRPYQQMQPTLDSLLASIRQATVVGSDETGLRLAGKRGWLWVVQTPDTSYFAAVDTRAASVLEDIMGEACVEVWCSDLYSAQLKANAQRYAICNAHQLRDLQYAIDAGDTVFAPAMQQLLRAGLQLTRRRSVTDPDDYAQRVRELKATARLLIDLPVPHPDVQRLQKRFDKHFEAMWLFLDREDVPFDNNASERALRPAATHRKVIGCFRTEDGASAYAAYRSLEDTARKRQIPILSALAQVLGVPLPS
jgi:transposase